MSHVESNISPEDDGDGGDAPNDIAVSAALEVWKKTIDVQQHFNDIQMKIRNFACARRGRVRRLS